MPIAISRLRRWFAAAAVAAVLLVAGAYYYAQRRVQNVLKQVPEKIGVGIQQTADGFTISGSDGARTLFKIQASKVFKFQVDGRAELHNVAITLYGRDSTRFDQIYGSDFEYDQRSGDVVAKGEVQIDLEANPAGLASPDQATPVELKNPIHLKTSGLTFNQKTDNAVTKQRVDFRIAQASGSAVGVVFDGKNGVLTLQSQVSLTLTGPTPATVTAAHGMILKDPRLVLLEQANLQSGARRAQADKATLFLSPDNNLERILASGNVQVESEGDRPVQVHSTQLEIAFSNPSGTVRNAVFWGDVQMDAAGQQPMQASAQRAVLNFAGNNVLAKVHAEEDVKMLQRQKPSPSSGGAQDVELKAAAVDFFLKSGHHLDHTETSGEAQIAIRPVAPATGQTLITAGKFEGYFDTLGQLMSIHGAPEARIVSSNPGQPDRVSTSQSLEATFRAGRGIESVVQQGSLAYSDGDRKAWAERARYTPADQMLVLIGSPRVVQGSMTTTSRSMRFNRATGDAFCEGDVKSTYSDLKAQPEGALLASSSPIHVTAAAMTAHRDSAVALYSGNARLWQDANAVSAPAIEFDRDHRSMVAAASPDLSAGNGSSGGSSAQPVSTVLFETDKNGKTTPVAVNANRLTYADDQRKAHFEGNVIAKAADFTVVAGQMDVFLEARGQTPQFSGSLTPAQPAESGAKLERIVAREQVIVTQATRRATGDQLVYTAKDDKFVMTGGPPSIFDAEQGKITGDSLTLFRTDDRVLVEGTKTSPSVTQTRVAR